MIPILIELSERNPALLYLLLPLIPMLVIF